MTPNSKWPLTKAQVRALLWAYTRTDSTDMPSDFFLCGTGFSVKGRDEARAGIKGTTLDGLAGRGLVVRDEQSEREMGMDNIRVYRMTSTVPYILAAWGHKIKMPRSQHGTKR